MKTKDKIRAIANERLPERLKLEFGIKEIEALQKEIDGDNKQHETMVAYPTDTPQYYDAIAREATKISRKQDRLREMERQFGKTKDVPVTLQEVLLMLYQKWNYKNQKTILVDVYRLSVMKIKCFSNNNKQETYLKGEKISEKTVSIVEGVIKYDLTKSVEEQSEETQLAIYKLIK